MTLFGHFQWADGSAMTYRNGISENYVGASYCVYDSMSGSYSYIGCTASFSFVCERPETGSLAGPSVGESPACYLGAAFIGNSFYMTKYIHHSGSFMDVDACGWMCRKANFEYSIVSDHYYCSCGQSLPPEEYIRTDACDVLVCPSNPAEMCGGVLRGTAYPTGLEQDPNSLCQSGWYYFNGYCYHRVYKRGETLLQSQFDAHQSCLDLGADLASIHSQEEEHFIWFTVLVPREAAATVNVWIGLRYNGGTPVWTDTTPFDYDNTDGSYDCVRLSQTTNGLKWTGHSCISYSHALCKKPAVLCPSGWDQLKTSCYKLMTAPPATIDTARTSCQSEGGHLGFVRSAVEMDFVQSKMMASDVILTGITFVTHPQLDGTGLGSWILSERELTHWTSWAPGGPVMGDGQPTVVLSAGNNVWQIVDGLNSTAATGYLCRQELVPEENDYVGCYWDIDYLIDVDHNGLGFLHLATHSATWPLTPEACTGLCKGETFLFSATQYDKCYCGNSLPGTAVQDYLCDHPCFGDTTKMCGNNVNRVNSVYRTGAIPNNATGCPLRYFKVGDDCFRGQLTEIGRASWDDGRTQCQTEGGDLAMIKTESIRAQIYAHMKSPYEFSHKWIYIGSQALTSVNRGTAGFADYWKWLDGTPVAEELWDSTQPSDGTLSDRRCLHLYEPEDGLFADLHCLGPLPFVCQIRLPVDECSTGVASCHLAANCTDLVSGYNCTCMEGYTGDGFTSCDNMDECSEGSHDCDVTNGNCTDVEGSFLCSCLTGFSGDGVTCLDTDECSTGEASCDSAAGVCTNSDGSFSCDCDVGYTTVDGGVTCTDDDECTMDSDNCDSSNGQCTNALGSFNCSCIPGYSTVDSGLTCTEADECTDDSHNCDSSNGQCTNTPGSFTCSCNSGYSTTDNGVTCTDNDECTSGSSDCDSANGQCVNTPGSFTCSCLEGYSTVDLGLTCTDRDECTEGIDDCDTSNGQCTNTVGSFTCSCSPGYDTADNGVTCTEVDECTSGTHNCDLSNGECGNTPGSFTCSCLAGYSTSDFGITCTDDDECGTMDNCDAALATCTNMPGSFQCSCNAGHSSVDNGVNCLDEDECTTGSHNCDATNGQCTNSVGSFTCLCNVGYTSADSGISCTAEQLFYLTAKSIVCANIKLKNVYLWIQTRPTDLLMRRR